MIRWVALASLLFQYGLDGPFAVNIAIGLLFFSAITGVD